MGEQEVEDYQYFIKNQLPLPEELITWFYTKADEISDKDDITGVMARFRVVSDFKLGFSPKRWAKILEEEGNHD